jgi:hypothetical protein
MLIRTLLTATLLTGNTYYPLKKITHLKPSFSNNLILYDRCLFYNNSCVHPIEEVYPDLHKYNNIFVDEINIGINDSIKKLLNLNNTTNYKVSLLHSNTVRINLNSDYLKDVKVILTPLKHDLTRVFIFNNLPNYKKTLLYYNIRFIINKIRY